MIQRILALSACAIACFGGVAAATEDAEIAAARTFADETLRRIGAQTVACSASIEKQVQEQAMNAVCARFENSFSRFEVRWDLQMIQLEPRDAAGSGRMHPTAEPLTEWELNGAVHDRIYRVGNKAVGVRFAEGDVLIVW